MKKAIASLLAAAVAGFALPAAAQQSQTYPFRNEVSVFGSWDNVDEPEDVEVINVNVRYGYFMSQQLLATGELMHSSFDGGGSDSTTTTFLVGAKYYFNRPQPQQLAGFVNAGVGFADSDVAGNTGTDFAWQVGIGASLFFTERTSFDGGLNLYWVNTDSRTQGLRAFIGLTTRF